jgi:PIN domain nuclease of toxin-antitoxin system
VVLDASALLALVNAEPGAEIVAAALADATIGTVNLAEVVSKLIELGIREQDAWAEASDLVPSVVDFDADLARRTARLRLPTRALGLSLGDRACLALAERLRLPALTADRAWQNLSIPVEIRLVR